MINVPVYIAMRFAQRFFEFFDHWYRGGSRFFWNGLIDTLSSLEGVFAVAMTVRHIFEPLYQDKTIIGYILGFIFRTLRATLGLIVYLAVIAMAFLLYLAWLLAPAAILYKIFEDLIF